MVELEELDENFSEDEVDQKSHNKLLSAVSRIYNKQRVVKPKRSEPCDKVSEYHLSNYDGNESSKEKIEVFDLVKVLDRKTSHQKIKSKFSSIKDRSSKLPKPLEKVYEDKIKRSVGYEHLKQHVSRWNEIVELNHIAPQLSFPLNQDPEVKVYKPLEFLHTFKEPTELEKNMAEVLQQSSTAQLDSQVEEAIFSLSIPEMIEKRRMMAKLKAKESFKVVKAMKQNKIKSKKYRRIVRKERLKQELKDFENLQKTDPEAALEKLNKLEKERAEERASLRHRNTGKWARGQAIRAKYDVEARKQLAEQISKSRELTKKKKLGDETSSEEEPDDDEEETVQERESTESKEQDDNPWTQKDEEQDQTMEEFIAGYQNYWKNKKVIPKENPTLNKAALSRLIGKDNKDIESKSVTNSPSMVTKETEKPIPVINQESNDSLSDEEIKAFKNSMEKLKNTNNNSSKINKKDISHSDKEMIKVVDVSMKGLKDSEENSDTESLLGNPSLSLNETEVSPDEYEEIKNNLVVNSTNKKPEEVKISLSKKKRKRKSNKESADKTCIKNISGSWEVTPERLGAKSKKNNRTLDDLFDKMEDDIQYRVRERLKKFADISDEEQLSDNSQKKKLKMDKAKSKIKLSEVNLNTESTGKEVVQEDEQLEDLLKVIDGVDQTKDGGTREPVIDPNKFLNVKPRVLNTQIPDVMTEGDDILDDPEDNQRLEISEAFAEDDVVEEFRKEKEDELKASGEADIDLFLPGWGSWGGACINPLKTSRKKKRFFIKAPKIPRKDSGKPNVIINQDISEKYKTHLVSEVPYPFTSVRDYEASIRAPIGSTWVPETSVNKLTKPPVVKKIGQVIEPMTETYLLKNKRKKASLKVNNFDSVDGSNMK